MGAAQWSNAAFTNFHAASRRGGGSGGSGDDPFKWFVIATVATPILAISIAGWSHVSLQKEEAASRKQMIEQQKTYVPERNGHLWKCYDWSGKEYWFDPCRAHQWQKMPDGRTEVVLDTFTKKRTHKSAPLKDVRDSVLLNLPSFEILDHLIEEGRLP